MERVPNGRYTKEFREEAVRLATEGGFSVPETAQSAVGKDGFNDPACRICRFSCLRRSFFLKPSIRFRSGFYRDV